MSKINNEILDLARDLNADSVTVGKGWKGYNVYKPEYKDGAIVGLPYVILEKDGKARISTEKEAFEYLDFEVE